MKPSGYLSVDESSTAASRLAVPCVDGCSRSSASVGLLVFCSESWMGMGPSPAFFLLVVIQDVPLFIVPVQDIDLATLAAVNRAPNSWQSRLVHSIYHSGSLTEEENTHLPSNVVGRTCALPRTANPAMMPSCTCQVQLGELSPEI